ncbi:hypothetical protein BO85DRAFT_453789 [Aspergillus piperis CBS 112811]|uniref:Uncharacterized protein n=1 Tax=Aspergillus piperis CBS 112811 TaxID=1448313 RepID=A0A8G1QRT3_9EURO|nr:hypothetical protein BO85DRAFT_453789 [Aspergillus piperis CBS 112811]RAH52663.1 hypothetical protein BO85DRAFT_453789 [Aspergillus piperis CBS 112811]
MRHRCDRVGVGAGIGHTDSLSTRQTTVQLIWPTNDNSDQLRSHTLLSISALLGTNQLVQPAIGFSGLAVWRTQTNWWITDRCHAPLFHSMAPALDIVDNCSGHVL